MRGIGWAGAIDPALCFGKPGARLFRQRGYINLYTKYFTYPARNVCSSARHPKQLVRDARTALLSAFDTDVDYQKFSVAQVADELGAALAGVQRVAMTPVPVVVVLVEMLLDGQSTLLVGAAAASNDEAESI